MSNHRCDLVSQQTDNKNNDTNSVALLMQLVTMARDAGEHDLATWLQDGIDDYFFHDEPLERALNLHAQTGQLRAKTIWMKARRDEALRNAFSHIEGRNTYQRVMELKKQLSDFETRIWPRFLDRDEPPAEWSKLRKDLFRAMKSGCTTLTSTSQIYAVLGV